MSENNKAKKKIKKTTTAKKEVNKENFLSVLFVNKAVRKPLGLQILNVWMPSFLRMELWDLGFEHADGLQTC